MCGGGGGEWRAGWGYRPMRDARLFREELFTCWLRAPCSRYPPGPGTMLSRRWAGGLELAGDGRAT